MTTEALPPTANAGSTAHATAGEEVPRSIEALPPSSVPRAERPDLDARRTQRRISGKRVLVAMLAIVGIAAVPAIAVPALWRRGTPQQLEELGVIPAFSLTDERGQPFTEDALRGHPTIVSFVFTRCDTVCPITTSHMRRVQDKTFDPSASIKLLSISVDPGYDTPERLAAYAQRFHADSSRWRFVTGPAVEIQSLVEGAFMTSMQRQADRPDGVPNIAHSGYFALVDDELHIRGMYDTSNAQRLDQLVRDAKYLVWKNTRRGAR